MEFAECIRPSPPGASRHSHRATVLLIFIVPTTSLSHSSSDYKEGCQHRLVDPASTEVVTFTLIIELEMEVQVLQGCLD